MSARAWDEDLLDDVPYDDPDDPSWDDATELLWDEHLARQEARAELDEQDRNQVSA